MHMKKSQSYQKVLHDAVDQSVSYQVQKSGASYVARAKHNKQEYQGKGLSMNAAREKCAACIIDSIISL